MATVSSHILDSVSGDHASGIRIECLKRQANGVSESLFNVFANEEGRISESIDVNAGDEVQLHIFAQEYFDQSAQVYTSQQIMPVIVVQLTLLEASAKYHVPIMLSPHAYSVWWSGKPARKTPE